MDFKEWFCLRNRNNFTIDPKISPDDARFYFGRDDIKDKVLKQVRRSFVAPGTPKMMVWGPYGSGKTQTLFYLDWTLRHNPPPSLQLQPHTVHLDIEVQSKSDAAALHMQLLEVLGKETVSQWVRKLFAQVPDLKATLNELTSDPNVATALEHLRTYGDISLTAWRWLTGQTLTTKELENLGVTRSLGQVGAGDMVVAVIAVGYLAERNGEKLIFLLDEMEELQNVRSGDATESIHQYFRRLSDTANSTAGFIVGFKANTLSEGPRILTREDISSRIGMNNYIEVGHLPAVSNVKRFMEEMLEHLVDSDKANARIQAHGLEVTLKTYPFAPTAFDLLADFASQDPYKALPRNIINAINECAIQAWDEQKPLVDEEIVNNVAPLVFG
jgi:hypothetical protein